MSGSDAYVAALSGALANATEIGWRNLNDEKPQRASASLNIIE
jgi:hypothetical protein